jgi:hypothetical protein
MLYPVSKRRVKKVERPRKTIKAVVIGRDLNPVLLVYKIDPFYSSVPFDFVGV